MNNLQHIVKDNTRFAMHMAVELCEQGDFDSVADARRWLLQERDDAAGTCELREASWDDGTCTWGVICSACGAKHEHTYGYAWNFAPCCGRAVKR